jgi:hypothetical protein
MHGILIIILIETRGENLTVEFIDFFFFFFSFYFRCLLLVQILLCIFHLWSLFRVCGF